MFIQKIILFQKKTAGPRKSELGRSGRGRGNEREDNRYNNKSRHFYVGGRELDRRSRVHRSRSRDRERAGGDRSERAGGDRSDRGDRKQNKSSKSSKSRSRSRSRSRHSSRRRSPSPPPRERERERTRERDYRERR